MTYQVLDNGVVRDATPEEIADIEARSAPTPAPVPASVTRRQAKQALIHAGLLDQIQPAIDAIADPIQRAIMQSEWEDSQDFVRSRPSVAIIGHAIGLDDAGIDALFMQAAAL